MELMHGMIVIIGIILIACVIPLLLWIRSKKTGKYFNGTRAANTSRIRQTSLYKSLHFKYRILTVVMIGALIGSVVSSLFLAARPYVQKDVTSGVKKRDIILCMDVSFSLYDLNMEVTDNLKNLVSGLEGDRFGINIFNSSSITYVPLTDDYDYVLQRLDELHEYFNLQKEYMETYENSDDSIYDMTDEMIEQKSELEHKLLYFDSGTRCESERGSSLIGEGLATALYSFPYLTDSERTRVIIMSTDNELSSTSQRVSIGEAANLCKKNKVPMFGIFPSEEKFYIDDGHDYNTCLSEFQDASGITGGKCYIRTDEMPVSDIVQNIQKQEALLVNTVHTKQTEDLPELPFIMMIICLAVSCLAGLVLQR